MTRDSAQVIDRFNTAFQQHDPDLLTGLIGDDCVLENTHPAPNGARFEGHDACLAFWRNIAGDQSIAFELENVETFGERGIVLWRLHQGATNSVRGVNIMTVRNGLIVEARGYVKGV